MNYDKTIDRVIEAYRYTEPIKGCKAFINCETVDSILDSIWVPTDFIQKKKLVIKELLLYIKALHMKKMTNFVINYKTEHSVEW